MKSDHNLRCIATSSWVSPGSSTCPAGNVSAMDTHLTSNDEWMGCFMPRLGQTADQDEIYFDSWASSVFDGWSAYCVSCNRNCLHKNTSWSWFLSATLKQIAPPLLLVVPVLLVNPTSRVELFQSKPSTNALKHSVLGWGHDFIIARLFLLQTTNLQLRAR